MNLYEEYAKTKTQMEVLQNKLKEIEPKILEEISKLSEPFKSDYGTFTKVTRESWKYTEKVIELEKDFKEKVEKAKTLEEETGTATKTETVGLRFIKSK